MPAVPECLRSFTRMVLEKMEPWDEVMAQASDVMVHAEGQVCEKRWSDGQMVEHIAG